MEQRSDDGTNSIASTSGNGHINIEMSIIEELDMRFGSAKNKHQILHSLEHCAVLHRIPLSNPSATSEQARKDFRRERVLLNDVPFIPDNIDVDRCNAFDKTLSILVDRMMRRKELFDGDLYSTSEAVTDAVLQRACRTSAGADSFFMVQKLLCVEGTFVTQRTYVSDPPIKIDVFVADPDGDGEYPNITSSRTLPSLPSRAASNNSSGIAMYEDGQRTPSATPPVLMSKRSMPSPLKISLKNMGFVKSSKPLHRSNSNGYDSSQPVINLASVSVSEQSSPAFTPPSTPPSIGGAGFHTADDNNNTNNNNSTNSTINTNNNANTKSSSASNSSAGGGAICCRIQVMNSFAIYDVAAIENITGVASQDPDPWLEVEAIVVDESNFKTDRHWRKLQLIATCPATGKVYTSAHDASASMRHSGRLSGRMILQELTSWLTSFPSHLHHHSHHHEKDHHHHKHNHNHTTHTRSETAHTSPGVSIDVRDPSTRPLPLPLSSLPLSSLPLSSLPSSSSPGLSPSISPMSTSTHQLDCSFVSVASAEASADFSPVGGPTSHAATAASTGTAVSGGGVDSGKSALSLQSASELRAAALASLQQELDTPKSANSRYSNNSTSAPHSLKYSTNPSPASPLKGLQVSSADGADGTTGTHTHQGQHQGQYQHQYQDQDQYEKQGQSEGQSLSRGDSLAQSDISTDSALDGSITSTGAVHGGGSGGGSGSGGNSGGLGAYGPGGIPLPVRTHEDLDLLIPSLRLLPGRSGYSSESSSTGDEGAWQDRDSRSNSSHSAEALSSVVARAGSRSNPHSNNNSEHDRSQIVLTEGCLE